MKTPLISQLNPLVKAIAVGLAATLTVGALATPVAAEKSPGARDPRATSPIAEANPAVPAAVIAFLPDVVKQSRVTIDPTFRPGSPITYPDGTPVPGQSEQAIAAIHASDAPTGTDVLLLASAYACMDKQVSGLPGNAWGPESICGVAVFGSNGYSRYYTWGKAQWADTSGCVQGRGFSNGTPTWYSLSCGTSGSGFVPWGNVLGNPKARAKSLAPLLGFTGYWSS